ncbi:MAG TPA: B12-binding domain-containing radical SAM protein, partial [Myxococcota bacterium]|nr:B12-binding domain-containing radical SAM protein [Myxococcota bacterium]
MAALDDLLLSVRHPSRYLGGEVGSVRKAPADVRARLVLAYPELYELGMSYLGFQVLYEAVNQRPGLAAERVFAPDLDMERALRAAGEPLRSLESGAPLSAFDVIGFSLQHELNLPDVLCMLELGGVPLRAAERQDAHPLVLAGGPCAANPEPLAEALDAVFLGEADRALPDMLAALAEARRRGAPRRAQLDCLQSFPGVYLPGRYRPRYAPDGRLAELEPLDGAPARITRALQPDLGALPPPTRPVVPWMQTVHDRLTLEIQRGCTHGCRFCQAGMITRPVRQRALPALLPAVDAGLGSSGHDEVSLLSLSAGDHPQILALLAGVIARHAGECVSVSLPSLRAETLTPALAEQVRAVRKSGFTIAPEAGSERLRRVINKDLSDQDVLRAALGAFAAGWQLIKL